MGDVSDAAPFNWVYIRSAHLLLLRRGHLLAVPLILADGVDGAGNELSAVDRLGLLPVGDLLEQLREFCEAQVDVLATALYI